MTEHYAGTVGPTGLRVMTEHYGGSVCPTGLRVMTVNTLWGALFVRLDCVC